MIQYGATLLASAGVFVALQTIDLGAFGTLLERFGLPVTMLVLIIIASTRGDIVWKASHEAIVKYKDDQIRDLSKDKAALFSIAMPMVAAIEKGTDALKEQRGG